MCDQSAQKEINAKKRCSLNSCTHSNFELKIVVGGVLNFARLVVVSGLDHSIVRTDKLTDNDRSHGRTSPNIVPPRMSLSYKGTPVDRIDGSYAIL